MKKTQFVFSNKVSLSCQFGKFLQILSVIFPSKVRLTSTCNIAFHQKPRCKRLWVRTTINNNNNKQHFTFDRSQEMREEIFLCTRVSQNKSRHQSRKHSLGNKPWWNCCQLVGKRTETNTPFVK